MDQTTKVPNHVWLQKYKMAKCASSPHGTLVKPLRADENTKKDNRSLLDTER